MQARIRHKYKTSAKGKGLMNVYNYYYGSEV